MTRLLLASLLLAATPALAAPSIPTVIIDPGHGGIQKGAKGPGKLWEKDLTLAIARKLARRLRTELKVRAILTRNADAHVFLEPRTAFANSHGADLFISIHLNSMPTRRERARISGVETYFLSADASDPDAARVAAAENADKEVRKKGTAGDVSAILDDLQLTAAHQDSSRLAKAVHTALIARLGAVDRGVQQAPFVVLEGAQMPAILCELGFISHPEEGAKLASDAYQDEIAEAMVLGVKAFLEETRKREATAVKAAR